MFSFLFSGRMTSSAEQNLASESNNKRKLKYKCQTENRTNAISEHLCPASRLGPLLYGENLSRVENSLPYPSSPTFVKISYMSLQNLANR